MDEAKKVHVQENRQGKKSSRPKIENLLIFCKETASRQPAIFAMLLSPPPQFSGFMLMRSRQPKEMLNFIVGEKTTKGHYKRRFVNLSS